jgi:hypothetical protein
MAMVMAARAGGLLVSILCHLLILLIPLSLATRVPKTYPPVELVMTMAAPPAMVQGERRACIARLPIKFALKN